MKADLLEDEDSTPQATPAAGEAAPVRRLKAGRPSLEEARELTQTILKVATHHFLEYGYQETTFDRIAQSAGTSKTALYSRYPEKVALFSEVCRSLVDSIYSSNIITLDLNLPIRACLSHQGKTLIDAALNPTAVKLYEMITRDAPRHPELAKSTLAVWDFYVSQMESYFIQRITHGRIALRNPRQTAERFVQMVFGPVNVWLIHGRELPSREWLHRHVEETVLVFLGGIGRLELETL